MNRTQAETTALTIPEFALVVLVGPSGSGKSTFARRHFARTEVVSSDFCRGLIADDENDQGITREAFELLHVIAAKRLAFRRLTVIDATNVQVEARRPLVALAREYHALPIAIVFDLPERLCQMRNRARPDRDFGPHVVKRQRAQMRRSLRALPREGFRYVYRLRSEAQIDAVRIERTRLWCDRRDDHGPFDIIGDVHGCYDELVALLERLGYEADGGQGFGPIGRCATIPRRVRHPAGRKVVFLGDLIDRGPRNHDVLRLVLTMVREGLALAVPGNHDVRLVRKLRGRDVRLTHGLAETIQQLERADAAFRNDVATLLESLVSHYVLDGGRLVVAHAGLPESMHNRASAAVRQFALYGETTGETDAFGLPVRANWAARYRGRAVVVYGHTPVAEAQWLNGTINIDTGCVFGGRLTALRWPEKELVSVEARRAYAEPVRPHGPAAAGHVVDGRTPQQQHDDLLDIRDVLGRRLIATRLAGMVTIGEAQASAALEVISRFAIDPKWLIYLPPTMAPCDARQDAELLEHPREAFAYFRRNGVGRVVCQEKHMGSRAVVIVCRDERAALHRFGVRSAAGVIYTRTGRRFFDDPSFEAAVLGSVRAAMDAAALWEALETDWVLLDCELMPWSLKAEGLLRDQYAAVASAGRIALREALGALEQASARGRDVAALLERFGARAAMVARYAQAYRRYGWAAAGPQDVRLAPFHLLASEGRVHADRAHSWHMNALHKLCEAGAPILHPTPWREVDLSDPAAERAATQWWFERTDAGSEGMVVKPLTFVARGPKGLLQPALKCRGREYLRIIYGPEYTAPEHLERLRRRSTGRKRGLALREFALGIEALERFVRGEPLRRVHECVAGVLALETEPVDPRL